MPLTSSVCAREGLNKIDGDCTHYHNCVAIEGYYRVYTYQCPTGLVFDQIQGTCTPSNNVEGCPITPPVQSSPEVEEEKELEPLSDTDSRILESDSDETFGVRKPESVEAIRHKEGNSHNVNDQFWTRDYKCPATGYQRHPKYCNQYYSCERSHINNVFVLSVFYCPVPLVFDDKNQVCDWPQKVPDCSTFSPIQPAIPVANPPQQEQPSNQPVETQIDPLPELSDPDLKRIIIIPSHSAHEPQPGSISLRPSYEPPTQITRLADEPMGPVPRPAIIIPPRGHSLTKPIYSDTKGGQKGGTSSNRTPFWHRPGVKGGSQTTARPGVKNRPTLTTKPPIKGKPQTTTTTSKPPIKGRPPQQHTTKPTTTTTTTITTTTTTTTTTPPPPPTPTRPSPEPHPHPQPHPHPDPEPETEEPEIVTPMPEPEKPQPTCDSEGQYYIDVNDCSKFYRCSNGLIIQFECPMGLLFDPVLNVCNWPQQVTHPCGRPRSSINSFARSYNPERSIRRKAKSRSDVTQSQYFWITNGNTVQNIPFQPKNRQTSYRRLYYDTNGNQMIILPQNQNLRQYSVIKQ